MTPEPIIKQFQYYAFISYCREDRFWAEWLQSKIENYRIPKGVRVESGNQLPKHIRPIFLDTTDMGVGDLRKNLSTELEDSRFLIVICSPEAAASIWVNTEVQNFISLGRGNRIIPFIVSGTPDPVNEGEKQCYPPVLDKGLLGASLTELKKEKAFVKVIAFILGLKFDLLWQRHSRNEKRKRNIRYIAIGFMTAVILAASFITWQYNKITVKHFADYVDRWGIPAGISELGKGQYNKLNAHYVFRYQRNKLRSVVYVNSQGVPMDYSNDEYGERPVRQNIYYNESGKLEKIDYLNKDGRLILSSRYAGDEFEEIDFKSVKGKDAVLPSSISELKSNMFTSAGSRSMINHYTLARNSKGEIIRIKFKYGGLKSVSDENGVFGKEFSLDSTGRVLETTYLDQNDSALSNNKGITRKRYKYDKAGNIATIEYLNKKREPILSANNVSRTERITDNNGNVTEVRYFDEKGYACVQTDVGYAIAKLYYDKRGNRTEVRYFNKKERPCLDKTGIFCWKSVYDSKGQSLKTSSYGVNEKPCFNKSKYSSYSFLYDEMGNKMECAYYDTAGKPCFSNEGFAKWKHKYDNRRNLTEETYYGTDDKPCIYELGYAKAIFSYDSENNQVGMACFGLDGQPCLSTTGFSKRVREFDERDNIKSVAYFGSDDKPSYYREGYSKRLYQYDEKGNQIEIINFGTDDKMCFDNDGVARWTMAYDSKGNITERKFFGPNDSLILFNGYAIQTYENDARGNLTTIKNYDVRGKACIDKDGIAITRKKYDDHGNVTEESYFDTEGHPTLFENTARIRYKYDELGNQTEVINYGKDGRLCLDKDKVARFSRKFDNRGNILEESYFGIDGKPCLYEGTARSAWKYDDKDNEVEETYYGIDGKPILYEGTARRVFKYDEYSNEVEAINFDARGNICLDKDNVARWTKKWDRRNNKIEQAYFDLKGMPTAYENAVKIVYEYDERNRQIKISNYSKENKLCFDLRHVAVYKKDYDDRGNLILIANLDTLQAESLDTAGVAVYTRKYDQQNRIAELSCFDNYGKPCQCKKGYIKKVFIYSESGQITGSYYYTLKGIVLKKDTETE